MLIVLSPAKTLDFDSPVKTPNHTLPEFQDRAADLVGVLRKYSPARLSGLMDISDQLATLNAGRFAAWSRQPDRKETRQAIFAFNGDVYEGLDVSSLTIRQLDYAQSHIRILSGLYGVLRPLDLMQPYRLEMGTALANPAGRNLYAFWGTTVTGALNAVLVEGKHKALINLASEEYFKSVKPALLDCPVITPVFEDWKGGRYKVISFHAKRARGLMARYAAIKRIADPEKLKKFDLDGYAFDARASGAASWVFRRRLEN